MRKLISTQSELQQQIDQIVDKAKFDQSLDDDFIFDDEDIDELTSPEHQLEEPMKSINKDTGQDAFNNVKADFDSLKSERPGKDLCERVVPFPFIGGLKQSKMAAGYRL